MKLQLGWIASLGLLVGSLVAGTLAAAQPAAAQGTFSPGYKPPAPFGSQASTGKPKSYLPAQPAAPSRPRTYGAPEAPKSPGFEPYKPFTGSSVYSRPSTAPRMGAKPCETSVYVNACGNGN